MRCINCRKSELVIQKAEMTGEVQGETFSVMCEALVCPNCGFKTVGAGQVQDFMKLLADEFRQKHFLMTGAEIKRRRKELNWSQQDLAEKTGVGLASIKRWEMGKIQDKAMDQLLRLFLDPEYIRKHLREMEWARRVPVSASGFKFSSGEDSHIAYKPMTPLSQSIAFDPVY